MRARPIPVLVLGVLLPSCALLTRLDDLRGPGALDAPSERDATDSDTDDATVRDANEAPKDAATKDATSEASAAPLQCGTGTCPLSSDCCNYPKLGFPSFSCVKAGSCTGTNRYVLSCDATSCGSQTCCVRLDTFGFATSASCADSCVLGTTALCASKDACVAPETCKAGAHGLTGQFACSP